MENIEKNLVTRINIQVLKKFFLEYIAFHGNAICVIETMGGLNLWLEDTLRIFRYLNDLGLIQVSRGIASLKNPSSIKTFSTMREYQWLVKTDIENEPAELSPNEKKLLEKFKKLTHGRPSNNDKIDQYYSTPYTNIKRLRLLRREILKEKKNICFFGDDDLTSLMFALDHAFAHITVYDIDKRIVDFINNLAKKYNLLNYRAQLHDYRNPIKTKVLYDIFHSDPPATNEAIDLVLKRARQIASPGAAFYLSWPEYICHPEYLLKIQKTYSKNSWLATAKFPEFNEYDNKCFFNYIEKDDYITLEKFGISKNDILKAPPLQRYCLTRLILSDDRSEPLKKYSKEIYLSNIHKIPK